MQLLGTIAFGAMTVINLTVLVLVMAALFRRSRPH
jgi:hypothetical protein